MNFVMLHGNLKRQRTRGEHVNLEGGFWTSGRYQGVRFDDTTHNCTDYDSTLDYGQLESISELAYCPLRYLLIITLRAPPCACAVTLAVTDPFWTASSKCVEVEPMSEIRILRLFYQRKGRPITAAYTSTLSMQRGVKP